MSPQPRLLINALSVTNTSGHHVLLGHLQQIVSHLHGHLRLVVVVRDDLAELRAALNPQVDWVIAPAATRHWMCRALWERVYLPRLAQRHAARAYFTPSGIAAHGLAIPQIVFCQNPWALVPAARRRRDACKAWLQRRAYRLAMRVAEVMVFNSRYMQEAYRTNAGFAERRGMVVYQAANDSTHLRARQEVTRQPQQIVCVSAMAPHKNIETLVRAFQQVRAALPAARLVLAGGWPDAAYERKIRRLVAALGLNDAVDLTGFVSRERLEQLYAESRVFCLMSRCESFGIPAIEAQLFGTPVISSTVCAIPEICGAGGRYCDPDDVPAVAAALGQLLQDDTEWQQLSAAARTNAARFVWAQCSQPLINVIADVLHIPELSVSS